MTVFIMNGTWDFFLGFAYPLKNLDWNTSLTKLVCKPVIFPVSFQSSVKSTKVRKIDQFEIMTEIDTESIKCTLKGVIERRLSLSQATPLQILLQFMHWKFDMWNHEMLMKFLWVFSRVFNVWINFVFQHFVISEKSDSEARLKVFFYMQSNIQRKIFFIYFWVFQCRSASYICTRIIMRNYGISIQYLHFLFFAFYFSKGIVHHCAKVFFADK